MKYLVSAQILIFDPLKGLREYTKIYLKISDEVKSEHHNFEG